MNYETERGFSGNPDAAFDAMEMMLMPNGFKITDRSSQSISFTGRGMKSTKENAIRGVTRLRVSTGGGKLRMEAFLGGARFMMFFLCLFPPILCLGLALIIALTNELSFGTALVKVLPAFSPWPVLSPLMIVWIRKRTVTALEDFVDNAVFKSS